MTAPTEILKRRIAVLHRAGVAIHAVAIEIIDSRKTMNTQISATDLANLSANAGLTVEQFIARRSLAGVSLHGVAGPFSAGVHGDFPLKWHAPLRDGTRHPADSVPGWPLQPRAEGTPAPDTGDDDDTDDDADEVELDDPAGLGLNKKKVGVRFPGGRRI